MHLITVTKGGQGIQIDEEEEVIEEDVCVHGVFDNTETVVAAEDDLDCARPPHHNHHQAHAESECCADQPWLFPKTKDEMHEIMHKCFEEAGIKKHPHGPPPPEGDVLSPPPPPFNDTARDCLDQCLFKALDILSDDGELKADEIKALAAQSFTGDWAAVGSAAVEKCLAHASSSVDKSSKCKSGAHQAVKCFGREVFLNCPASQWSETDECKAVKERLTKCPNMPAPKPHLKKH